MARRIAPEDLTWLLMDRPNNRMHVHSLIGYDRVPDLQEFSDVVMERMVRKYRRLSQIPVQIDGDWYWEDDVNFSISTHVRRVILEDMSPEGLRAYVSGQFSEPLEFTRPLWEMQLVTGPEGTDGYTFSRFHHGLGDGIRLVQMLVGVCDPVEGATPRAVGRGRGGEHLHPLERVMHVIEESVSDTLEFVGVTAQSAVGAGRRLIATTNPLGLAHHVSEALDLVRSPVRLVDAVTGLAPLDNEVSNSWRELTRMLLSDGHKAVAWSGQAGVAKSVAWLEGFPLDGVRDAAQAYDCTLNDILMAAVSLALTDYLAERGVTQVEQLSWLMPVSLMPFDGKLPSKLGNKFALVMFAMPIGMRDPVALIKETHERTTRLKHSVEPIAAFGFQRIVAESPTPIARRITDYFAGKTVGQLSNVPGPRVTMKLAGMPLRSILGWVPTSSDQPLGICLFSYDGTINLGVATDARMIPDPLHLTELIEGHLDNLVTTRPTSS